MSFGAEVVSCVLGRGHVLKVTSTFYRIFCIPLSPEGIVVDEDLTSLATTSHLFGHLLLDCRREGWKPHQPLETPILT